MNWIFITLISAVILGSINLVDKKCHQYCKYPGTYMMLCGFTHALFGIVCMAIVGFSNSIPEIYYVSIFDNILISLNLPTKPLFFAILSGGSLGFAVFLTQRIIFSGEVSRTMPIAQSYPVFSSLLAGMFLNEIMSSLQWVSILVTVLGCILLTIRFDKITSFSPGVILKEKSFYILIFSSLLFAISFIFGKLAFSYMGLSVLFIHGVRATCGGSILLIGSISSSPARSELFSFIRQGKPKSFFFLNGLNNFVIAQVGFALMIWGLELGPVSLVTALSSTRTLFTVIFSIVLGFIWKGALGERNTNQDMTLKIGSTLLIVAGVSGISIF